MSKAARPYQAQLLLWHWHIKGHYWQEFLALRSGKADPQDFWQKKLTLPAGVASPLLPSKAAVTVRGTKGGLQSAGPAQTLVVSHYSYSKILQAPSLDHRLHWKPSFARLNPVIIQMSLKVANNTPAFTQGFLVIEVLRCSPESSLERGKKGRRESESQCQKTNLPTS